LEKKICKEEKEMNNTNKFQEFEEVCKPVVKYLKENYDPHCTVVITDNYIKLVRDEMGIPIEIVREEPVLEGPTKGLGMKIRLARVAKNMTLEELSKEVGIERHALSRIERGLSIPRKSTFEQIKKVLGWDYWNQKGEKENE
jgi:DNA-binding XRE family transcriptional regulator